MATTEVPRRQVVTIAQVADALNRLDGLKMTLLAITFGCLAAVVRRGGVSLPRGLAVVFVATALTLLISAAGYLTLNDHLATAAFSSLPLLMASVTASGIALGRRLPARPGRA